MNEATVVYYDKNHNEGSYIEISSETDEVLAVETGYVDEGKTFRFIISGAALKSILDAHTLKRFKIKVYKVEWNGEGNNKGYAFGVEWYDKNDNFLDVLWFPTEEGRDEFYESLKAKNRLWECPND